MLVYSPAHPNNFTQGFVDLIRSWVIMVWILTGVQVSSSGKGQKLTFFISTKDGVSVDKRKNLKCGHVITLLLRIIVTKLELCSLDRFAVITIFLQASFVSKPRGKSATISKTQLEIATKGEFDLYCSKFLISWSRYCLMIGLLLFFKSTLWL